MGELSLHPANPAMPGYSDSPKPNRDDVIERGGFCYIAERLCLFTPSYSSSLRPTPSADMRSIPWASKFDGAYCLGNSFYFGWENACQFLNAVALSLKPGARFVLDNRNGCQVYSAFSCENRWFRLGDLLMLSENRYDPAESRLDIDYTFIRNGQVETRPTTSYVFTAGELCRMHVNAGLQPVELLGSTHAEPYQIGSPRLLLVSVKR